MPVSIGDHLGPISANKDSLPFPGAFAISRNPSFAVTEPDFLGYIHLPIDWVFPGVQVLTSQGDFAAVAVGEWADVSVMRDRRIVSMDKSSL